MLPLTTGFRGASAASVARLKLLHGVSACDALLEREARCGAVAGDQVHRDRAGAQAALLASAGHQRSQRWPPIVAPAADQHTNALRSVQFVRRGADQVDALIGNVLKLLAEALGGIDMQEHRVGKRLGDLSDRLDHAGLVVDVHDADQPSALGEGTEHV